MYDVHVHTTLQGRYNCKECPIKQYYTPNNIGPEDMFPNGIFVFGSNTSGIHGSGAAKFAKQWFGAKQGVGEGLIGNSYAFPTLNADSHGGLKLVKRSWAELFDSVCILYNYADDHPELIFWLTKVGCGLAKHKEIDMQRLFQFDLKIPKNIIFPEGW